MKKGKTILGAIALGALTYLAYLALDLKNPVQPTPVATPYAVMAETPASAVPVVKAVPARRIAARKAVRVRAKTQIAAQEATPAVEEKKPAADIPMPSGWGGRFEKQELRGHSTGCDIDRPCSPRGRDGVLLVGASFALNGWAAHAPQNLAVGSYRERTPLLVYK